MHLQTLPWARVAASSFEVSCLRHIVFARMPSTIITMKYSVDTKANTYKINLISL